MVKYVLPRISLKPGVRIGLPTGAAEAEPIRAFVSGIKPADPGARVQHQ